MNQQGFKTVTFYTIDHHDFEDMVNEHFSTVHFNCVATFEWNNYSDYTATVKEKDLADLANYEDDFKSLVESNGRVTGYISFGVLLAKMVQEGRLELGNYMVKVFW